MSDNPELPCESLRRVLRQRSDEDAPLRFALRILELKDADLRESEASAAAALIFDRRDVVVTRYSDFVGFELAALIEHYFSGRLSVVLEPRADAAAQRCAVLNQAAADSASYDVAKSCTIERESVLERSFLADWRKWGEESSGAARLALKLGLLGGRSVVALGDTDAKTLDQLRQLPTALIYLTPEKANFHPVYARCGQLIDSLQDEAYASRKLKCLPRIPRGAVIATSTVRGGFSRNANDSAVGTRDDGAVYRAVGCEDLFIYRGSAAARVGDTHRPARSGEDQSVVTRRGSDCSTYRAAGDGDAVDGCRADATAAPSKLGGGGDNRTAGSGDAFVDYRGASVSLRDDGSGGCYHAAVSGDNFGDHTAATGGGNGSGGYRGGAACERNIEGGRVPSNDVAGYSRVTGMPNVAHDHDDAHANGGVVGYRAATHDDSSVDKVRVVDRYRAVTTGIAGDDHFTSDGFGNGRPTTMSDSHQVKRFYRNAVEECGESPEAAIGTDERKLRAHSPSISSRIPLNGSPPHPTNVSARALPQARDLESELKLEALRSVLSKQSAELVELYEQLRNRDSEIKELRARLIEQNVLARVRSEHPRSDVGSVPSTPRNSQQEVLSWDDVGVATQMAPISDDNAASCPTPPLPGPPVAAKVAAESHRASSESAKPQEAKEEAKSELLGDHPRYRKYFKMLNMHVPRGAVQAKMRAEGVDPDILNKDPATPVKLLSTDKPEETGKIPLGEDPRFAKYFRMLKMHLPRMAVEAKMRAEGYDPAILDMDVSQPVPDDFGKLGAATQPTQKKNNKASKAAMSPDQRAKKMRGLFWSRLKKRQVGGTFWEEVLSTSNTAASKHDNAIEHAMSSASTAASAAKRHLSAKRLSRVARPSLRMSTIRERRKSISPCDDPTTCAPEKQKRASKVRQSIVARLQNPLLRAHLRQKVLAIALLRRGFSGKRLVVAQDLVLDLDHLEMDFCDTSDEKRFSATKQQAKRRESVCLISSKRSQAIQIALGTIKSDFERVHDGFVSLDADVLPLLKTQEGIEMCLGLCPTHEEQAKVENYLMAGKDVGVLAPAETFFAVACEIPRLAQRLNALLVKARFAETLSAILAKVEYVQDAALRIEKLLGFTTNADDDDDDYSTNGSTKANKINISQAPLAALMCMVLAIGNYMNFGSRSRGDASGFLFDLLTKLSTVKCNDIKHGTLLNFVVEQIGEERAMTLVSELTPSVEFASRVNFEHVDREFKQLEVTVRKHVIEELKTGSGAHEDERYREPFRQALSSFVPRAQQRLETATIIIVRSRAVVERLARRIKVDLHDTTDLVDGNDGTQQFFSQFKIFLVELKAAIGFNKKRKQQEREARKQEKLRQQRKAEADRRAAAAAAAKAAAAAELEEAVIMKCGECHLVDSSIVAGAYSNGDGLWYCADCWTVFAASNETWFEDFGQETEASFHPSAAAPDEDDGVAVGEEEHGVDDVRTNGFDEHR